MTLRKGAPRGRQRWGLLVAVVSAVILVSTSAVFATHPEVGLLDSNFEIDTDANLKVDDAGSLDWANVTENRRQDLDSGSGDNSFGQGTKENTAIPSVVDGSIPPNKSDLKFFGVYQEGSTSNGFLNLFWSRVQDPSGTTNMDFEFNQSSTLSSNGVTPVRTTGDLLIIYDLSQGGTNPTLSKSTWNGSSWGDPEALNAGVNSAGSINTSAIPVGVADGLGPQSARTFGEAQLRLASIFPDPTICASFGSAYLKSRSSDSFTSALKDFIAPQPVNISNCGSISIHKQDDAGTALAGAVFGLFKDNAPLDGVAPKGAEDTAVSGKTCTTNASGNCSITGIFAGQYWVSETTTPAGYQTAPDQNVTVTASDTAIPLTFVDPRLRGAIRIEKSAKHKDTSGATHPNLAATFTVTQGATTIGTIVTDGTTGIGCLGNLLFGSYTVTETGVPAGYAAPAAQTAAVNGSGSCPAGSVTKQFLNTPLTDITVSVHSQVAGGTASKITCTGLTPTPDDTTPTAFDDTSETVVGVTPGTYTCTIVVDP